MSEAPLLFEIAVTPKTTADIRRFQNAISRLTAEQITLRARRDPDSNQTILCGANERVLAETIAFLKERHHLELEVGAPQVAYRETISKVAEVDYTHKKQSGGSGQYARVKLRFEPLPLGSGYQFQSEVTGGVVPQAYVPGVVNGLAASMNSGVIAGFPVVDLKAVLYDGAYHDVDSSALAFEIAARAAVREGLPKASPKLLEPIMDVAVATPVTYWGDIIGDLQVRRASAISQAANGDICVVLAEVPLANLFSYEAVVSTLSRGCAVITVRFSHYAPVPFPSGDGPFAPAAAKRA